MRGGRLGWGWVLALVGWLTISIGAPLAFYARYDRAIQAERERPVMVRRSAAGREAARAEHATFKRALAALVHMSAAGNLVLAVVLVRWKRSEGATGF